MSYNNLDLNSSIGGGFAGALWMSVAMMILSLIICVISIVSIAKIFKKAGKPGIYAIIPIYNIVVMFQIIKMKFVEIFFILIPIVGPLIFMWKYNKKLADAFGKSSSYALGLFFLNIIFIPMLAFSDDEYVYGTGDKGNNENTYDASNGITAGTMVNNINGEATVSQPSNIDVVPVVTVTPVSNVSVEDNVNQTNDVVINDAPTTVVQNVAETTPQNTVMPTNEVAQQNVVETIPNAFETVPQNTVMPTNEVAQQNVVETTPNAFETVPQNTVMPTNEVAQQNTVETIPNAFETVPQNSVETMPNITDITPQNNIEQIETLPQENISQEVNVVNEQPVIEPLIVNETQDNIKKCKNCGSEMPNIVTICPKCGTDNE